MEEIVRTQIMIMRVSVDFSRFTFILVTLALLVLVGCSRPPEIIGIDNPELRAEAEALSTRHRIFITSTRAPSDEPGALLSANRARTLGLASVDVLSKRFLHPKGLGYQRFGHRVLSEKGYVGLVIPVFCTI